ncbi:hypothetical protein ABIF41_003410 [Bradyrhizobium japonicum]
MNTPAVTIVAAWISAETGVGAFHRVRQPGVQQELRRLAHRAHEQQEARQGQRIGVPAEEVDGLAGEAGRGVEDRLEIGRADQHEDREDAECEAEVADAVDHEGLDGGGVRRRLLVPEPDQQVAGETHALPAEEQLHEVVRRHQHQHGEGEQREIAEEARPVRILVHIADGIEVHERGHGRHHHQHHGGERVDPQRPVDLEVAGEDPRQQRDPHVVVHEADIDQRHPGQHRRHEQQSRRDQLRRARACRCRLDRSVVIVSVIVVAMVVMGRGRMRIAVTVVAVMLDLVA